MPPVENIPPAPQRSRRMLTRCMNGHEGPAPGPLHQASSAPHTTMTGSSMDNQDGKHPARYCIDAPHPGAGAGPDWTIWHMMKG